MIHTTGMNVAYVMQRRAWQPTTTRLQQIQLVIAVTTQETLQHVSTYMTMLVETRHVIFVVKQEPTWQTIHTITTVIQHVTYAELLQEQRTILMTMDVTQHVTYVERQEQQLTAIVRTIRLMQTTTGRNV